MDTQALNSHTLNDRVWLYSVVQPSFREICVPDSPTRPSPPECVLGSFLSHRYKGGALESSVRFYKERRRTINMTCSWMAVFMEVGRLQEQFVYITRCRSLIKRHRNLCNSKSVFEHLKRSVSMPFVDTVQLHQRYECRRLFATAPDGTLSTTTYPYSVGQHFGCTDILKGSSRV